MIRRGTVGSILKSELGKAINCFGPRPRHNDNNGGTGNGINGSGYRYARPPTNGPEPKSVKNGHNYYQSQALLRKEAGVEDAEANAQLWWSRSNRVQKLNFDFLEFLSFFLIVSTSL